MSKCVESDIQAPDGLSLLWDIMRVMRCLIRRCRDEFGSKVPGFADHRCWTKRRILAVMNAKNRNQCQGAYTDLLKAAKMVLGYCHESLQAGVRSNTADLTSFFLYELIENCVTVTEKVIDQTRCCVFCGEKGQAHV